MKSIEERVNQWAVLPLSDADRRNLMRMALIELADDLQAEKEKEVAELREKLAAIEAGSDIQSLSVSSHFELDCGPIKAEPALLDEVKRVLVETQPHVCSICCPSVKKDGTDWVHVEECQQMTRLIYRLGGVSNDG